MARSGVEGSALATNGYSAAATMCDGTCDVCVEYAVTGVPKGFASACAVGPTDASDMKCNFRSTTSRQATRNPEHTIPNTVITVTVPAHALVYCTSQNDTSVIEHPPFGHRPNMRSEGPSTRCDVLVVEQCCLAWYPVAGHSPGSLLSMSSEQIVSPVYHLPREGTGPERLSK